jgi:hypothetical protein
LHDLRGDGVVDPEVAGAWEFGAFWHGPLNALTFSCMASFAHAGACLRVYSFDAKLELPPGVELADAREICPDETLVGRYFSRGKPSLAAFSDLFRYRMVRETGRCWVDCDFVCLARPDIAGDAIVFGRQSDAFGQNLIASGLLKLPRFDPRLDELVAAAHRGVDTDLEWAAIGPFLLTEVALKHGLDAHARDFRHFYAIEPENFRKPFLPEFRDEVAAAVSGSSLLHLWNELIARCGYDYQACPPVGSFLHETFQRIGTLGRFDHVCSPSEARALLL